MTAEPPNGRQTRPACGIGRAGFHLGGVHLIRGIYTAAASMMAETMRQDATTNNIANVNTTGFKRDTIAFESFPEMLLEASDRRSASSLGRLSPGSLVSVNGADLTHGAPRQTQNPLDVYIVGEGFFVVETPEGEAYTRDGSFVLGPNNQLYTAKGHPVLGTWGRITLTQGEGSIDAEGRVFSGAMQAGVLRVVRFDSRTGWTKDAYGYLVPPADSGQAVPLARISLEPGYVEDSNVNAIREMVNLITVLRSYEAGAKALAAHDQTLEKAVNEIAR